MPRCKNCKEKFEVKHFNQKYCFNTECVSVWVEKSKKDNWKKLKKKMNAELETTQDLICVLNTMQKMESELQIQHNRIMSLERLNLELKTEIKTLKF